MSGAGNSGDDAPRRARRSDRGSIRFWERDRELLTFVAEQYAVTVEQLARLTGSTQATAHALRNRWRRANWIESHPLLWRGPSFVWLTPAGARAAQSPYRALAPNPGMAAHIRAVSDVRLLLEHELSLGEWECERSLARHQLRHGSHRPRVPDGVLSTPAGPVAVEVELTLKTPVRLETLVLELARSYPEVWYFASSRVAPALRRLAAQCAWRNVVVHEFPPAAEDVAR